MTSEEVVQDIVQDITQEVEAEEHTDAQNGLFDYFVLFL